MPIYHSQVIELVQTQATWDEAYQVLQPLSESLLILKRLTEGDQWLMQMPKNVTHFRQKFEPQIAMSPEVSDVSKEDYFLLEIKKIADFALSTYREELIQRLNLPQQLEPK